MARQTTRDAALSRLFGTAPGSTSNPPRPGSDYVDESIEKPIVDPQPPRKRRKAEPTPPRKDKESRGEAKGSSGKSTEEPAPSGYIGLGRYTRSDGVVERITPYVRPDQAEALRIAVARKTDPRGTDVSQIIQSLLDEAGYSS